MALSAMACSQLMAPPLQPLCLLLAILPLTPPLPPSATHKTLCAW
jgi:hypothetical protein